MSVVPVLVAFSLLLAAGSVALFIFSARNRDHEHADRLSLLPLEDDLSPEESSSNNSSSSEDDSQ